MHEVLDPRTLPAAEEGQGRGADRAGDVAFECRGKGLLWNILRY